MISAPLPPDELERLNALARYEVLDTKDEKAFDELTQLASNICGTSISLISLVDNNRQWFKSKVGLDAKETSRDIAFCSHAILQEEVFEVPDTALDKRFADNPLVTADPDISFYAGAPLVTPSGHAIGTLCVIDPLPKKLTQDQSNSLQILARQVVNQLELRLYNRQLQRMQTEQEQFFALVAHDLRSPFTGILGLSKMLTQKSDSLDSKQLEVISKAILDSSLNVYQLLDELLQWSRNQLGAVNIDLESASLSPLINETVAFMKDALEHKSIQVSLNLDSSLKAKADKDLFKTIMRNLLANGIKYSPDGAEIFIEAFKQDSSVVITVCDQGPGVSTAIKKQLFNECVESDVGSAGEVGHGLGLKLCQVFAHKQQGVLSLDESYEQGAKLVLTLQAES